MCSLALSWPLMRFPQPERMFLLHLTKEKKIIFLQICELIQLLLCSQASRGAAATEEIDPLHWEEGQGRGVKMPLSPEMRLDCFSFIRQVPWGFSKVRQCDPLCWWPEEASRGILFPERRQQAWYSHIPDFTLSLNALPNKERIKASPWAEVNTAHGICALIHSCQKVTLAGPRGRAALYISLQTKILLFPWILAFLLFWPGTPVFSTNSNPCSHVCPGDGGGPGGSVINSRSK